MQMIYEYDDQGNPKMREYELVVVGVMKTDYSKRRHRGHHHEYCRYEAPGGRV